MPPQADPRDYDLNAYGAQQGGRNDWQQPQFQPQHQPHAAAPPALDPGRYPNPQMAPQPDQSRAVVAEQDYAHDDADYEDEPPRRSRGLLIVGALVGAIALGGGLAYAYKSFLAPSTASKATPRVAADKSPARTQPADAGGKQFANTGVKVMGGRLTEGGDAAPSPTASNATVGEDGVRRVPTVAIRPDGSMSAPAPQAPPGVAPPVSGAPPGIYVVQDPLRRVPPGIQGVGGPSAPPAPQAAPSLPPARSVAEPRTITLPPPRDDAVPAVQQPKTPPRVAVATPPPAAALAPQAEAAPAPKKPLPRPTAPAAAPAGGGGYVAVLASQRSQMDALRTFADLQQKYGVLQGKSPSVQEVNLGEKGVFHRLMVGPPGSREQASALCNELKSAGYTGCWVTAQ